MPPKYHNEKRVQLFRDTLKIATAHHMPGPDSTNTKYDYVAALKAYQDAKNLYRTKSTIVRVINQDTIDLVLDVSRYSDGTVLVLNLASDYMPGGGCRSGCLAQEEQLYYCTNYDLILGKQNRNKYYPLDHAKADSVLTTGVSIIRNGKYDVLKKGVKADFLALPALRKPSLVKGNYQKQDYETMNRKIESIFLVAAAKGYKTLVLGAIGCGAYHNPPYIVVEIFSKFMQQYRGHFDEITFAVLARDPRNPNFVEFQKLENKSLK